MVYNQFFFKCACQSISPHSQTVLAYISAPGCSDALRNPVSACGDLVRTRKSVYRGHFSRHNTDCRVDWRHCWQINEHSLYCAFALPVNGLLFSHYTTVYAFLLIMESEYEQGICGLIVYALICKRKRRKASVRKYWTKQWLLNRNLFTHTNLLSELRIYPSDFHNYQRMNEYTYL